MVRQKMDVHVSARLVARTHQTERGQHIPTAQDPWRQSERRPSCESRVPLVNTDDDLAILQILTTTTTLDSLLASREWDRGIHSCWSYTYAY